MTSGNLVHGSCMVTHGSGNGGNAKWPDKICECVRVNCLNCEMETRTIECVAFNYHEGAKGDDFSQKNKFRCCINSSHWGSVVKLHEHVRWYWRDTRVWQQLWWRASRGRCCCFGTRQGINLSCWSFHSLWETSSNKQQTHFVKGQASCQVAHSLRKHPFLLALRSWERFRAKRPQRRRSPYCWSLSRFP